MLLAPLPLHLTPTEPYCVKIHLGFPIVHTGSARKDRKRLAPKDSANFPQRLSWMKDLKVQDHIENSFPCSNRPHLRISVTNLHSSTLHLAILLGHPHV